MNKDKIHSLLPYLQPARGKISLQIAIAESDFPVSDNIAYPFLLVEDSDPLAFILSGQIISDNGSPIRDIYLQIQRDNYSLVENDFLSITNSTIDQCWQQSYQGRQSAPTPFLLPTLAEQLDKEGNLTPLHSLFFCKKKNTFFHPPCPNCGQLLHLCKDETLLSASNLESYNNSLRRFLFCPECHGKTEKLFYCHSRYPSDPSYVLDGKQLLLKYKQLISIAVPDTNLPCQECKEKINCSNNNQGLSAIHFVSFYPFFMQICSSISLGAPEYIALLSGASHTEIQKRLSAKHQAGRKQILEKLNPDMFANRYLFATLENKHFLEVLYLKIVLLETLSKKNIENLTSVSVANSNNTLNNTWVYFTPESLLPTLWNYSLFQYDIGQFLASESILPKQPSQNNFHTLGLVWFHTLLVNSIQKKSTINSALSHMLQKALTIDTVDISTLSSNLDPDIFRPEQLFWTPDTLSVPDSYKKIWEKSLQTGWYFFILAHQLDHNVTSTVLLEQLQSVKNDTKKLLFSTSPSSHEAQTATQSDLTQILSDIEEKWLSSQPAASTLQQKSDKNHLEASSMQQNNPTITQNKKLDETILISPENRNILSATSQTDTSLSSDDDTEETIMISPENRTFTKKFHQDTVEPEFINENDQFDLPPTIHGNKNIDQISSVTDNMDMNETLIVSPSKQIFEDKKENTLLETIHQPPKYAQNRQDDTYHQKLNQTSHATKQTSLPAKKSNQARDELAETVIIKPRKKQ